MSIIALKWAYSQPIQNPVAKNVLAFLASHNFPGNKTFFAVQTICGATAYSRRAVIEALKWLVENKYLKKEIRIAENGGQQTNVYILNIPEQYLEDFCSDYTKLSPPPVQEVHPPRAGGAPPPVQEVHPNNNIINNNINKSSYASLNERKKNNEKKHDWADKPKPVSVENQSNSMDKKKLCEIFPVSDLLAEFMEKNK